MGNLPTVFSQFIDVLILSPVVSCISWTVTREEVFKEAREWFLCSFRDTGNSFLRRKLCYLFTCEYCFSHWVALVLVIVAGVKLCFTGVLGPVVAWFSVVWFANHLMSVYDWLRQQVKKGKREAEQAVNWRGMKTMGVNQ